MDLVPEEIQRTVLCSTFCSAHEDEKLGSQNGLRIAVCTSNGYLLEILDKKIMCFIHLPFNDTVQLITYYQFKGRFLKQYYIAVNKYRVAIIKKKDNEKLVIVSKFLMEKPAFKNFLFHDMCYLLKGKSSCIAKQIFSLNSFNQDNDKILSDSQEIRRSNKVYAGRCDALENIDEDIGQMTNFLTKRLEEMRSIADELTYEIHSLNAMFRKTAECVPDVQSHTIIRLSNIWFRVHQLHWVIGIEFSSFGVRNVHDIKLTTRCKTIGSWIYRLFTAPHGVRNEGLSSEGAVHPKVQEEKQETIRATYIKCIAVIAVDVPDFSTTPSIPLDFILIFDNNKVNVETIALRVEDLISEKFCLFHEQNMTSLAEDLMACLVTGREVRLVLKTEFTDVSLENIIVKKLGFRRVKLFNDEYFIKDKGFLLGTVLSVKRVFGDLTSWNLNATVRNLFYLKVLLRALISGMPSPVTVMLGEI